MTDIMTDAKKYYAFISYKREDKRYAMWLQRKLEYYKLPVWARKKNIDLPERVRPIFRDVTDLSGGVLEKAIREGLDDSRYLIVICSPSSAGSKWVGKEVQTFIDTGREEQIIPFIIDGTPNSGDPRTECYPESLRRLTGSRELLGISVHEGGRHAAFIKVVARMFGLGFDELWGRYRRQRRMRQAWLAVACALLLAVAGVAFDFFRTKTEYYADYVVCEGMPVGILPLSAAEVSTRPYYYRFESSRRKLRRVVHCNMWGVPANHTNTARLDRYAIQEIGYENEVFSSVTQCDAQGTPIYRESYNPPRYDRVDLKDYYTGDAANLRGSYTSINPMQQQEQPFNLNLLTTSGKAKIGRYVLEYDAYGYAERRLFKRYNGDNSHVGRDNNGVCGLRYVRDSLHRVVEQYYLDEDGEVMADKYGVAGRKYRYDELGNVCEEQFVDLDGKLVMNELLYARGTVDYRLGEGIIERYYGADGKPCLNKHGFHCARVALSRDSLVNTYFGLSDEPVLFWDVEMANGGYHKQTVYLDKQGHVSGIRHFGTDSQPVYIQPGLHFMAYETDDIGRPTSIICYGTDGRKVNTNTNVCEVRLRYAGGKEVEKTFYDNRGRRVNAVIGYSRVTSRYENSRLVERRYYDRNDLPTLSSEIVGAHALRLRYDDSGNATEVWTLGTDGEQLWLNSNGFARAKMEYDEAGNCIQSACYDTEGRLTTSANGAAIVRNDYYPDGTVMRTSYYNRLDSLAENALGYAVEEFEYNAFGLMTERRFYDRNHRLKATSQGCAVVRYTYANNRLMSASAFDEHERPAIETAFGCHRVEYEYDSRGYQVAITCWNVDGSPMLSQSNGCWRYEQIRNLRGQVVEERSYDTAGRLMPARTGAAIVRIEYTDNGNISRMASFDENGKPVTNTVWGCSSSVNTWDEQGRPLQTACFDAGGKPMNNRQGFHRMTNTYDADGRSLMMAFYDKDGRLCMAPFYDGAIGAIRKALYNGSGELVFSVVYDAEREGVYSQYVRMDSLGCVQGYLIRSELGILEMDAKGNIKSHLSDYYGPDKATRHLTDSLNGLLDSLEERTKYMYEWEISGGKLRLKNQSATGE